MLNSAEEAACPAAARPVLVRYLAAEVSGEIALMHLLMASGSAPALQTCLRALAASGRRPLARLERLATQHAPALATAARLVEAGLTAPSGTDRLAATRDQYNRAVALSAEAAVALYSLGDPLVLARATAELAALLERWGLLSSDRTALDIGCGIGRMERALASRLRYVVGIDLSPKMIVEARRRCVDIANVAFAVTGGIDLAQFVDASFDLVLAIDSFPCLIEIDAGLARHHIAEAARVLRPGGALVIFNYSYRGDLSVDRADIAAGAAAAGLDIARNGTRDLALWDGTAFLLNRPNHRG